MNRQGCRGELRVGKFRLGNFVHNGCAGGHRGKSDAFHGKFATDVACHDHGIVPSCGLDEKSPVYQRDERIGISALHVFGTVVLFPLSMVFLPKGSNVLKVEGLTSHACPSGASMTREEAQGERAVFFGLHGTVRS